MAMQKITLGMVAAIAVMGTVAAALGVLVATYSFSNTGNVKAIGVGVYWDSSCIDKVETISWGDLHPGSVVDETVYVKNDGSVPVVLSMTTDSWIPSSARDQIALSWNREDHVLNSGLVVEAVLTLSVSSDISEVTSFSFNIIITGTEYT